MKDLIFKKSTSFCLIVIIEGPLHILDLKRSICRKKIEPSINNIRQKLKATYKFTYIAINQNKSCLEIYQRGFNVDGIYTVILSDLSLINVYCEMKKGGWTRIMNRLDNSANFNKNWADYKYGFGQVESNHWLGLENIRKIVNYNPTKIRFEFYDINNRLTIIEYDWITIGSEVEKYRLLIGKLVFMNATLNSFDILYHNETYFSTFDNRNDQHSTLNCATYYSGGWWFKACWSFCPTSSYKGQIYNWNTRNFYIFNKFKILLI